MHMFHLVDENQILNIKDVESPFFLNPKIVNGVTGFYFGIVTVTYKSYIYCYYELRLNCILTVFSNLVFSILYALCHTKTLTLGQFTSSIFTQHNCYICGNPPGTAGSLRASAVNKRAAAHMQ